MSHAFGADVMQKAKRRQRKWCQENLLTVLEQAKDRQARDIEIYAEKLPKPVEVPAHTPEPYWYRVVTSWDYGWQQKASRVRARDFNFGRCALLRDTFYRKNNPAPDPPHVSQASGGEFSVCTQYSCYFG
ncbi:hypothetical protein MSG28_008488 [Choristoneura fumiferana]|uniref:Uncharacterized protein n=2 Tax=Choristoneura fumiferana TaxID=7141 RepID=A0ACC0J6B8_CHOFU|nr:hypothetical protein MSG28_008488 [Choristoneura fumiferana]KAI8419861.1 hypothetical protein MSG28_008488 [Choristoneura fumiferana]